MAAMKKNARGWFQHGDVTIKPIAEIPVDAKPSARRVLAYGEVTGHSHRLLDEADVEVFEREGADGTLYIRVGSRGAPVDHEEHGVGVIDEAGAYEIGRVREYDHFAEAARPVRD